MKSRGKLQGLGMWFSGREQETRQATPPPPTIILDSQAKGFGEGDMHVARRAQRRMNSWN